MLSDAQAALAQVREALAAGPTPGEWACYDDSNDGKTSRIEIVAIGKTVARIYRSVPEQDLPNARLIAACCPPNMSAILAHVEAQKAEIERLTAELETERMRLAACGVVALANTEHSAAQAREMLPEYRSASLADVERAVDREMQLRAERDELRRQLAEAELDAERYRWLRPRFFAADFAYSDPPVCAIVFRWPESAKISANLDREIDAAMGLTRPAEES